MTIKLSTGLRNALVGTKGLLHADVLAKGEIRIYSGGVPSTADNAIDPAGDLLVTITNNAGDNTGGLAPLLFEPAANGVITKLASQTWSGTIGISGGATYWRWVGYLDADDASPTAPRVQGAIGLVGSDGNLSNTALVAAAVQVIDYFAFTLPTL